MLKIKIFISFIIISFLLLSCLTIVNTYKSDLKGFPLDMVFVEAGSFAMGYMDGFAEERPVHDVKITNNFYICKFEITNHQVVNVYNWGIKRGEIIVTEDGVFNNIGDNKILLDINDPDCQIVYDGEYLKVKQLKDNYPCIEISWFGAVVFCNLLSEIEEKTPCYDLNNWKCDWEISSYRLPTEAEWEFAAIGGKKSMGYLYAGGNNPYSIGWFNNNSLGKTHPVGRKKPNELGLYDMSGNVWEWCWDWYFRFYYYLSPNEDPKGPFRGKNRAGRGGSWHLSFFSVRNACRIINCDPQGMGNHGGFRVILPLSIEIAKN